MTVGRTRAADGGRLVVGVTGVVVAHLAGYAAVFPDPGRRARVLAATGHGYWHVAVLAAVTAATCAIVGAFSRGVALVRSRPTAAPPVGDHGDAVAAWLALARFQILLFATMEIGERVAAGHASLAMLHERTFVVGLLLQAVVAAVAVGVLALVARAGAEVARAIAGRPSSMKPVRLAWTAAVVGQRGSMLLASVPARGPPPAR